MQYFKRFIIISCVLFSSAKAVAQGQPDMTGLWTGLMFNDTTELNYRYEIAISEKNGKLVGYSQTFFILDGKEYYGVKKLKITIDGDKVVTQDVKLLDNNYPIKPPKGVYVLNVLNFQMSNEVMVLKGMFSTNRTKEWAPATGYIHVEKKTTYKESPLVKQLKVLGLEEDLTFLPAENPAEKPADVAVVVKPEPAKEQPVTKAEPSEKEKRSKEKPAEVVVTKPAPAKEQPVVKAAAVEKEKQQKEKPVKEKETIVAKDAVVKNEPTQPQKTNPVNYKEITENKKEVTDKKEVAVKSETPQQKPQETKSRQAASDINGRQIETIQSVNYVSDSLVITLYDNGEVDGDTVSVVMNGEVIMPMVGLSTKAVRKTIYTKDIQGSIQIVMYAENLGTLPPNTGLLIVNDGKERYEIRFSGDLKKNSAIVFNRKENK